MHLSSLSRLPIPNWLPCLQKEKFQCLSQSAEEQELVLLCLGTVLELGRELAGGLVQISLCSAWGTPELQGELSLPGGPSWCFINQLNAHKRWSQSPWKFSDMIMDTGCNTGNSFQTLGKHSDRGYKTPEQGPREAVESLGLDILVDWNFFLLRNILWFIFPEHLYRYLSTYK